MRFWRRTSAEGNLVHDFRDERLDTRFLGDLYQDLSAQARDQYALLQTPEFVEEFILDRTLERWWPRRTWRRSMTARCSESRGGCEDEHRPGLVAGAFITIV